MSEPVTSQEMIDSAIAAYESGEWDEWLAWLGERGVRCGAHEYTMETSGWYQEVGLSHIASASGCIVSANIYPTGRVFWYEIGAQSSPTRVG